MRRGEVYADLAKRKGDASKTKRVKKSKSLVEPPPRLAFHWKVLGMLAALSCVSLLVSAVLPWWRQTNAWELHHYTSSKFKTYVFGPSVYGLLTVLYNNGARTTPWYTLATRTCAGADAVAQAWNEVINMGCDLNCISHYTTRCAVYKSIANAGYIILSFFVVSAIIGLVGTAWLFISGKNTTLLLLSWLGVGIVDLIVLTYWLFETDQGFRKLSAESMYPYASISVAAYLALGDAVALCLCGLAVWLLGAYDARQQWKAKQRLIEDTLIYGPDGNPETGGMYGPIGFSNLGQRPYPLQNFPHGGGGGSGPGVSGYSPQLRSSRVEPTPFNRQAPRSPFFGTLPNGPPEAPPGGMPGVFRGTTGGNPWDQMPPPGGGQYRSPLVAASQNAAAWRAPQHGGAGRGPLPPHFLNPNVRRGPDGGFRHNF